jgi:hypothetical protein
MAHREPDFRLDHAAVLGLAGIIGPDVTHHARHQIPGVGCLEEQAHEGKVAPFGETLALGGDAFEATLGGALRRRYAATAMANSIALAAEPGATP